MRAHVDNRMKLAGAGGAGHAVFVRARQLLLEHDGWMPVGEKQIERTASKTPRYASTALPTA